MIHNGSKATLDVCIRRRMPQGYNEQRISTILCILFLLHQTAEINTIYIYIYIYIYITSMLITATTTHFKFSYSVLYIMNNAYVINRGPGSSVGIATELRAGRSWIESRWGRDFPPVQTGPGAHPASCKMGTGSFPGVKCGRGVLLTTHPLLVPLSWKSRAIPLPTLWATPGL